ncbi:hypothetical protein PVAP13_2KG298291 [Panicum virgatum]|uniref:Uncharacterized protein n=1 Tax=Panicum virgatum TaxID=38727 RepID=A0A8T0W4P4_PANVG|nr:hypothetical protein PVAP13_2KG298291 [Panicum virgatum]
MQGVGQLRLLKPPRIQKLGKPTASIRHLDKLTARIREDL